MKKSLLLTLLVASLFAIGLTGCQKDSGTPPVLKAVCYTYTEITDGTKKSDIVPTTTITLTTDKNNPQYVTFIAEFVDLDLDAEVVHIVYGDNDFKYAIGIQEYESQISWWNRITWSGRPGTLDVNVYVTDKKGNKSNVIPMTLTFVNPED